ncbi:UDP-N-acetylglucosamine 1-carboxyvinyltransferase [Candidatus Gribaldobacteria bacterium]|nr:UDP-N-acetylglucosamine 1-carboxyvinyltransferase [Candidatus Gribaldobacteria bacterium]
MAETINQFIIEGAKQLSGEIEVRGSKNATAPILAACLLTQEECFISNLPLVLDILNFLDILKEMGCLVEFVEERKVRIQAKNIDPTKLDFSKFSMARTSVLLIGPLLARFNELRVSKPGGDRIGLRPITTHLEAFKNLGIEVSEGKNLYIFKRSKLRPAEVILPEFSVTATENLLLLASLIEGKTIIKLAAQEPHVFELVNVLRKMGVKVEGQGTHTLIIDGSKKLKGFAAEIIPDYLEAGTFLALGLATKSQITIRNFIPWHLDSFCQKLKELGANFVFKDNNLSVLPPFDFKAIRVQALPFPGFPTDLLPLIVPLLTQAKGKSLIHDPLYENRLNYVQELRKMGADIEIVDPHRAFVLGNKLLKGVSIESWDIRAGACLVIAGLIAQGKTTLNHIYQIDRGYEKLEERLQKLGANIKRV